MWKWTVLLCAVAVGIAFFSTPVLATPDLQLFISEEDGGWYDTGTETWVTSSDDFTLQAIVDDEDCFNGQETVELTLCIALSDDLYTLDGDGNVVFNEGTSITVDGVVLTEEDFVYGLPPISEVNEDGGGGDMPPHDIYPTAFTEITITIDDPGAYDFMIEDASAGIHFDLYTLDENEEIDCFAPFSHDAATVPPVPEPSTVALLASGLLVAPIARYWKKRRTRPQL